MSSGFDNNESTGDYTNSCMCGESTMECEAEKRVASVFGEYMHIMGAMWLTGTPPWRSAILDTDVIVDALSDDLIQFLTSVKLLSIALEYVSDVLSFKGIGDAEISTYEKVILKCATLKVAKENFIRVSSEANTSDDEFERVINELKKLTKYNCEVWDHVFSISS